MAEITRNPRETVIQETGARDISEALLAGPASGSNRFTLKRISLKPNGCTARTTCDRATVYFIHQGRVTLSHHEGELDLLSPGDAAVIHPEEIHHFHNIDKLKAVIIKVASQ